MSEADGGGGETSQGTIENSYTTMSLKMFISRFGVQFNLTLMIRFKFSNPNAPHHINENIFNWCITIQFIRIKLGHMLPETENPSQRMSVKLMFSSSDFLIKKF